MDFKLVKIRTTVPSEHADALRSALGNAQAGSFGNYSFCSFSTQGTGRFLPNGHAKPYIGKENTLETIKEEQIEVVCERNKAKQVIAALRNAHPYEEPIIDIIPLIAEADL